jgi:hypothetical protein
VHGDIHPATYSDPCSVPDNQPHRAHAPDAHAESLHPPRLPIAHAESLYVRNIPDAHTKSLHLAELPGANLE